MYKIENLNNNLDINNNLSFFILGNDIYLNNIVKNIILKKNNNIYNYEYYDIYIKDFYILYFKINNNFLNNKIIICINILDKDTKNIINFDINRFYNINIKYIFLYNKTLNFNYINIIKNKNIDKLKIIDCQINNKIRFIKFIKNKSNLIIKKKYIFDYYLYYWIYCIYNNNFFNIINIINVIKNIFYENKNISNLYYYNNIIIYNINYISLINSLIINNIKLYNINIFILKLENNLYKIFNLLKMYIYYFFLIKNNILYYNNNKNKFLNINKYLLLIYIKKIKNINLLKIFKIINYLELDFKYYNEKKFDKLNTWYKLEILFIYLYNINENY